MRGGCVRTRYRTIPLQSATVRFWQPATGRCCRRQLRAPWFLRRITVYCGPSAMILPPVSGDCTHSAEYQVLGSGTWTSLSVSSDAVEGYCLGCSAGIAAAKRHVCLPVYGNRLRRSEHAVRHLLFQGCAPRCPAGNRRRSVCGSRLVAGAADVAREPHGP